MFGYNRTKISGTLHGDPSEFHIVGSDIHNATMQKTWYSVSMATLNIYYIIESDIYTSKILRENTVAFHGNNGYMDSSQFYILHAFHTLLHLVFCLSNGP